MPNEPASMGTPPAALRPRRRRTADRVAAMAVWTAAAVVVGVFAWIIGDIVMRGAPGLSWDFLAGVPQAAGRAGGIGPIIASTLLILLVCLVVALPLGFATALLLAEYASATSRFGRAVRASLDVLAGVPSIVFGLFGNALFCVALGMGYSILSGGLTLACMVLPIVIRATELGLRSVPDEYRMAGAALGVSRLGLARRVLLPAAAPGLVAGVMLGIGRALAETAALIFTSGAVTRWPEALTDSGRTLSIHIYELAMNVTCGEPNAYSSALVLVGMLLVIGAVAHGLTDRLLGRRARP